MFEIQAVMRDFNFSLRIRCSCKVVHRSQQISGYIAQNTSIIYEIIYPDCLLFDFSSGNL